MAGTSVYQVHFSRPLETLSIGYHPAGLEAENVFAVVPVQKEADKYTVFTREDRFRAVDDTRDDGSRAHMVDFGWSYDGYLTQEHALETRLTDRERDNADNELRLQLNKVRGVQDILLLNQEIRVVGIISNTANYATSNTVNIGATGTNQWNNAAFAGSIEQNIDGGKDAIRIQTGGLRATDIYIPEAVALVMKRDSKIRDLIKYTHSDLLTDGELPGKLWGMNVHIPMPTQSTTLEGAATPNMIDIWGKHVWLTYRTPTPGIDMVNFGYLFRCRGFQVKTWRQEEVDATFFRPSYNQVEKIVSPYAGYFAQNVIS